MLRPPGVYRAQDDTSLLIDIVVASPTAVTCWTSAPVVAHSLSQRPGQEPHR
jgi:hypothetical protein